MNDDGDSPADLELLEAVRNGDGERARTLLAAGADPNTKTPVEDGDGFVPVLYFPSQAGNLEMVRLLLEYGADPTDGESVHHAAQHDRRDVLQLLFDHGADLSRGPAEYGPSPLYFLASHRATNPIAPNVVRGIEWLLEHGADPTVPLTDISDGQYQWQLGEAPLHRAAANGYGAEVLAQFVAYGADVDAARQDGATPYTLAVRSGNAAGALWLANSGANRSGVTVTDRLLCACLTGDAEEAQTIVREHPDVVASLSEADAAALLQAMVDEKFDTVQLMLSLGWPLTPQSEWGGTALHWAAWNAKVSLVRTLLEHGAPVNLRDTRYGSSPIAWSAHGSLYSGKGSDEDYIAIVNMLLDAGASRDEAINRWHEPPEQLARPPVVDVLKAHGFVRSTN
jgi:ankyrin repeat protein